MKAAILAAKLKKTAMRREEIAHNFGLDKAKVADLIRQIKKSTRFVLREDNGLLSVRQIKPKRRGMPITIYRSCALSKTREQRMTRAPKYASPLPLQE